MIEEITGEKVKLFRPPGGGADDSVLEAVDMPFILWDVDSRDWEDQDPDMAIEKIYASIRGGSVILMHDTYGTTATAVEQLVPMLVEDGYTLVTVSELFELYGVELEGHHMYTSAHKGTYYK